MIVVVGDPVLALSTDGIADASGQAVAIAIACVRSGATVQFAGKVGDDPPGDEVLLSLTRAGIGHVAILRDAGAATAVLEAPGAIDDGDDLAPTEDDEAPLGSDGETEGERASTAGPVAATDTAADPATRRSSSLGPEDLDLALRYLASFGVLIVGQPVSAGTLAVAVESAAYAGAHLILIDAAGDIPAVPVDDLTVLGSPAQDPDGDFAGLVGRYAAALDAGKPAAAAFRSALGAMGAESAIA